MADVKISALPPLPSSSLTDLWAVVQSGVTYRGTPNQLLAAFPVATGLVTGLLSSADWNTFNSKQSAITAGNISTTTTGVTIGGGTGATVGPSTTVDIATASALATGLLSSADWTTFNGKLSAAITSLGGLTGATQTLGTGTTGTDFAIVSSGTAHTFNLPTASATNRGALSSTDWTTFNSKQSALTFSTGLTNAAGTVTANLSTGVAGGQSVIGGTAASNSLTLSSTSNATKGKILFGTSAYDEVNNRLGIGTSSPSHPLVITVGDTAVAGVARGAHYNQTITASANNDVLVGLDISPTFSIGAFTGVRAIAQRTIINANTQFRGVEIRNQSNGTAAESLLQIANDVGGFEITTFSSGYTTAQYKIPNSALFRSSAAMTGGLSFVTGTGSNAPIMFWTNDTERARIFGSTGNVAINTTTDAGFRLDVNGTARVQERLTVSDDSTVTTQTVAVITTDTTNAGLVLRPNGTGAIMAQAPDGTSTGGNARGQYAVDFQMVRTANTQVASGARSFIGGGQSNLASGTDSFIGGGQANEASGARSVVVGGGGSGTQNQANGIVSAIVGGANNVASGTVSSISGGYGAIAYLYGQRANASTEFASKSDSQTSSLTFRRAITGVAAQELFLDGSSARAILNISSPGPTNARLWNAYIQVVAIVQTVGNGTVTLGDSLIGNYMVGIKRIGTATSLVGTVQTIHTIQADAGMAGAAVTITADDTNEALKIEFTPATNAGSTTVTRVVATAYLTEVGY